MALGQATDGASGLQQFGGVGGKTRIIEPPEILALGPERGAMPRFCCGDS